MIDGTSNAKTLEPIILYLSSEKENVASRAPGPGEGKKRVGLKAGDLRELAKKWVKRWFRQGKPSNLTQLATDDSDGEEGGDGEGEGAQGGGGEGGEQTQDQDEEMDDGGATCATPAACTIPPDDVRANTEQRRTRLSMRVVFRPYAFHQRGAAAARCRFRQRGAAQAASTH